MQVGDTYQSNEPMQSTNFMGDIIKVNQMMGEEVGFEFIYGWAGNGTTTKIDIAEKFHPVSADEIRRYLPNYK